MRAGNWRKQFEGQILLQVIFLRKRSETVEFIILTLKKKINRFLESRKLQNAKLE